MEINDHYKTIQIIKIFIGEQKPIKIQDDRNFGKILLQYNRNEDIFFEEFGKSYNLRKEKISGFEIVYK